MVKSGNGALFQVMVSSAQLLEVAHNFTPKSFVLPAQQLNVAPVIAVPAGRVTSNLKKLYLLGLASIPNHGLDGRTEFGCLTPTEESATAVNVVSTAAPAELTRSANATTVARNSDITVTRVGIRRGLIKSP